MVQHTRLEADPATGHVAHGSKPHFELHNNPGQALKGYHAHTEPAWGLNRLEFVRMIGRGYASRVWQCTDINTGSVVAVKVYNKADLCPLNHHQIYREAQIHSSIQHPNILPFLGTFSDPDNIYMVLHHCPKGDLYSYLKQKGRALSENQAAKYVVIPFLSTLVHLHVSGIIHRDIKPENILVTESGGLMLADFGLSIRSQHDAPVTRVGTLDYMAPEVVNCPRKRNPQDWKDRADLHYTAAVDVWALGVLVYELCLGEPPFSGENKEAVQQSIQNTDPNLSQLSDLCADFVRLCLQKEAHRRPTATQLQSHPWLQPYCTPTPAQQLSLAARPPSRTLPNGIQTMLAPRRPPTPPTPVSGSLSVHSQCADVNVHGVDKGVSAPIATPGAKIVTVQTQHGDGPCSHRNNGSGQGAMDGGGNPISTLNTFSSSPDMSGIMSSLKGDRCSMHASVALDTQSGSLVMEPQASYASSSCMSTMYGQGYMHTDQASAPVDAKAPRALVPQSSEHTFMNVMHAHDSKPSLSRETSALDEAFSYVSQTALPPLHAPHASGFTCQSTDVYGMQSIRHDDVCRIRDE